MRVTLPNGQVIDNVPEGTTQSELARRLGAAGHDVSWYKPEPAVAPKQESLMDAPSAVASGVNRGLTGLAGLPVDTIANILDLGKAGIGSAYQAVTGKTAPDALQLTDREQVPGSSAWFLRKARESQGGREMMDPSNPEYQGGYLQAAGSGLTGAIANPASRAELVKQAATGVGSVLASKLVGETTGNESAAITAGLLAPQAPKVLKKSAQKALLGDVTPEQVAANLAKLKAAGVEDPTIGLASQRPILGSIENVLSFTPMASGAMNRAKTSALSGMRTKIDEAAALASAERGPDVAGNALQRGVKESFTQDFKDRQNQLYDELGNVMGGDTPVALPSTRAALARNGLIPEAEALSAEMSNPRMRRIEEAIRSDLTPNSGTDALMLPVPPKEGLPFSAVKRARTEIGEQMADNPMLSGATRRNWGPLYGGMSQDIQRAAEGAGALPEFNRASNYTAAGMNRLERVEPLVKSTKEPEQVFAAAERSLRASPELFNALKKSVPEEARGKFASTVLDKLGKDKTGNWTPERFSDSWLSLPEKARDRMLSGFPNAQQVKDHIDAVAEASLMMKKSSKMWSSPEEHQQDYLTRRMLERAGIGGAGLAAGAAAAGFGVPAALAGTAVAGGAANLLARGMTGAGTRNFASNRIDPYSVNESSLLPLYIEALRNKE